MLDLDKNWLFIAGNGDIKKVPKCNIKLNLKANIESYDLEEGKEDSN